MAGVNSSQQDVVGRVWEERCVQFGQLTCRLAVRHGVE